MCGYRAELKQGKGCRCRSGTAGSREWQRARIRAGDPSGRTKEPAADQLNRKAMNGSGQPSQNQFCSFYSMKEYVNTGL
jgi:hypothetical protein